MIQLRLAWGVVVTMVVMIAISTALLFEPPWLSYTNLPFPVLNPVVKAGHVVLIQVSRCSTDKGTRLYAVSHTLEGQSQSIILPSSVAPIEPGCMTRIVATNRIPESTPPGRYRLVGYGEIQGIIRTHSVRWHSEYFEVTQ